MAINWENYEGKFFKLEDGQSKTVKMANWRESEILFRGEKKLGIEADILTVNGNAVSDKILSTSSLQLIQGLRPFFEAAEAEGKTEVEVIISRKGIATDTKYEVVAVSSEEVIEE